MYSNFCIQLKETKMMYINCLIKRRIMKQNLKIFAFSESYYKTSWNWGKKKKPFFPGSEIVCTRKYNVFIAINDLYLQKTGRGAQQATDYWVPRESDVTQQLNNNNRLCILGQQTTLNLGPGVLEYILGKKKISLDDHKFL